MIRRYRVTGIVQGVGFRPFVYQLATRARLGGWVVNTSAGVEVEVEGAPEVLDAFARALVQEKPPLARVDSLTVIAELENGQAQYDSFEIRASIPEPGGSQPLSPDIGICPDCLRELFDPSDRRYRYPFINCTNCGPRFTIIQDLPYDRPLTTMRAFEMCADCAREYSDPLNRRFHAQPIACPRCGPRLWFEHKVEARGADPQLEGDDALLECQRMISAGGIIAVKGLGGFHLACDATNPTAVQTLRERKLRVDKPFALMMPELPAVERHCFVSAAERDLLLSRERPIVLLRRRPDSNIAREVAPGQDTLGVMLPYTPLHYLLFAETPGGESGTTPTALVMTSGNLSEEPIVTDNAAARERLAGLADGWLMHDREIHLRCDDSVVRVFTMNAAGNGQAQRGKLDTGQARRASPAVENGGVYPVRRSRGYAPMPVPLPFDAPPLLAVGAELKNTFCVTRRRYAILSHHIGDLENYETLRAFEQGIAHFERLFRVSPEIIAYDLHPDYLATRYALERAAREGRRAFAVQHHHAHIAACMAENNLAGEEPVIGIAFDGTGYGDDGAIWGGEFLIANYAGYRRAARLAYVPLPGGDKATREPWRSALAWLDRAGVEWAEDLAPVRAAGAEGARVVRLQIERGINAPNTSSMGRLFDAIAALAGVRQRINYEAQAAVELEAQVDLDERGAYEFEIRALSGQHGAPLDIDPTPLIRSTVSDLRAGIGVATIAARFHNGLARMVRDTVRLIRENVGLNRVALSGGVWQNMTLLGATVRALEEDGMTVYLHSHVPANDGGIALGQAAVAGFVGKGE